MMREATPWRNSPKGRGRWYGALLATMAVIVLVFGVFAILEHAMFRDGEMDRVRLLHAGRGITASLIVGIVVAAYFIRRAVHTLPLRGDQFAGRRSPGGDQVLVERNQWLVRTRWMVVLAVAGAVATGAFAVPLVPAACRIPLVVTTGLIAISNLIFARLARSGGNATRIVFLQVAVDLFFLTVLLHFGGGLENPLMGVYILHVILAGTVMDRRAAYGVAALACLLIISLALLEGTGAIEHYTFAFFPHVEGHAEVSHEGVEGVEHGEEDEGVEHGEEDEPRDAPALHETKHAAHDPGFMMVVPATLCLLIVLAVSLTASLRENLRASEYDLVRNYKMAALGRLTAGLAHEINNPVGIATARTKLVIEDVERADGDPRLLESLRSVDRQLGRVAEIVSGMRAYARSTSGKREPLDLGRVVREVVAGARPAESENPPHIDLRTPDRPVTILADASEISQIVVNLVVNAFEALPGGGEVRIRVQEDGGAGLLSVEDDGPGMTPEVRSRIFEPFYSTKADRGGTGLGLAIVEGLVEANGGRIDVETEPGRGARFEVRFPLEEGQDPG